jgi:hypothetical protein
MFCPLVLLFMMDQYLDSVETSNKMTGKGKIRKGLGNMESWHDEEAARPRSRNCPAFDRVFCPPVQITT